MVGTLVVSLPSAHTGGELIVEHGGESVTYRTSKQDLSFVAFYADCRHEVKPVTSGYRVTLTFNLLADGEADTQGLAGRGSGALPHRAFRPEPQLVRQPVGAMGVGLPGNFLRSQVDRDRDLNGVERVGSVQHLTEGVYGLQERLRVIPEDLHAFARFGQDPQFLDSALVSHGCISCHLGGSGQQSLTLGLARTQRDGAPRRTMDLCGYRLHCGMLRHWQLRL